MKPALAALAFLGAVVVSANTEGAAIQAQVSSTAGGPLPEAVIYAIPVGTAPPKAAPKPATIDQINKEFVPFVVPVQVGAAVSFPNKDNIRHQVYSFSPAKVFDLKLYSGVPAKPVVFDKAGPVALGCNIHDWMVGYVYAVDTPWFAKSGGSGAATVDVPAGEYDVRIWHPWMPAELPAQRIRVAGANVPISFKVDVKPPPTVAR